MIQRIQSIYLFVAFLVLCVMFFNPLAGLVRDSTTWEYYFYGLEKMPENAENIFNSFPVMVLVILTTLICLVDIFLFKKRVLQMRLCIYNIILLLALEGVMYFYITNTAEKLQTEVSYQIPVILPLISIILIFLAFKGIKKDENLVRSYDRIR